MTIIVIANTETRLGKLKEGDITYPEPNTTVSSVDYRTG